MSETTSHRHAMAVKSKPKKTQDEIYVVFCTKLFSAGHSETRAPSRGKALASFLGISPSIQITSQGGLLMSITRADVCDGAVG